jgi:hypothetical protein
MASRTFDEICVPSTRMGSAGEVLSLLHCRLISLARNNTHITATPRQAVRESLVLSPPFFKTKVALKPRHPPSKVVGNCTWPLTHCEPQLHEQSST